jgi:hypothetical protein
VGTKPVQAKYQPPPRQSFMGKRMHAEIVSQGPSRSGTCRWCRCTYNNPCPQGCGWSDPEQTLCTACVDVEHAWQALELAKLPNMHRAFFRGYMAGADDERATERDNPNRRGGQTARYWDLGYQAGGAA